MSADEVSVKDAVESYLFNSQLLSRADGAMVLLVPPNAKAPAGSGLSEIVAPAWDPVQEVLIMDPASSMKNGGGPHVLRFAGVSDGRRTGCRSTQGIVFDHRLSAESVGTPIIGIG